MTRSLEVRGAREHNLRGVDVSIPRDSLVVVTGVSGSGKSSLAFDTIFQEGQRRFVDSLSAYARQFIGGMKRPDVESVHGISPTISIDQKTVNRNPRSTVGTVVEIMDHYRLLFARLGEARCPNCGRKIEAQSADHIVDGIYAEREGELALVLAPLVRERKGEYRKELAELAASGFTRVRVDGTVYRVGEVPALARYEKHSIETVVDRVPLERKNVSRLREAIEGALKLTGGKQVAFLFNDANYVLQGTERACVKCGISIPELEPRFFSFNDRQGQCPACKGLGGSFVFDPDLIVPDASLSLAGGALKCQKKDSGDVIFSTFGWRNLRAIAKELGFSMHTPWKDLPKAARDAVLYGTPSGSEPGVIPVMQELWDMWHIVHFRKFMQIGICPECGGSRLNRIANAVRFHGKGISELSSWSVDRSAEFFERLELSEKELRIGREIFKEIRGRLSFLRAVGLGYLTLSRGAATLSGGEAQRIRLAAAVGAGLQGVLYVLDEPSIGLHSRDNERMLEMLEKLRSQGNSLLVVEHDEETMRKADFVIDVGPGAGVEGGKIVAAGPVSELENKPESLTGAYLSGKRRIEIPAVRKRITKETPRLTVVGAREHNLKNLTVGIPLDGAFTVVTGVSGSGKSTLVNHILRRELSRLFYGSNEAPADFDKLTGVEFIDKVIEIDQTPIGRTPRSNPATYTKIFDDIRDLYASLPLCKARGYTKSRFSFNVKGGRCEACEGAGVKTVDMRILPSVQVTCDVCDGKRFNEATLEVYFRGKNITDVLDMSINEACDFFSDLPKIAKPLELLREVGLGYLTLGQPSTTLSGGEAQRVKISSELRRPGTGKTLYLLDEPTTGLHFEDIRRLLQCLKKLRDLGNSVVVIEHNMDVIKCADWVIDLGPEAGEDGGRLVAEGPPEKVARCKKSATGQYLAKVLSGEGSKAKPFAHAVPGRDYSLDLEVRGARKHNLKNFSVTVPRHKMTVITGVSGSGKSSLAFHTLFAEGQRRFVETLSTYARRFLGRLDRGSIDSIEGLAPAISIDQGSSSRSPRSTVATLTEVYDYFRVLWCRAGIPHCIHCGKPLEASSVASIVVYAFEHGRGGTVDVLVPLGAKKVGTLGRVLRDKGYSKILAGAAWLTPEEIPGAVGPFYALADHVIVKDEAAARLAEALERAYRDGEGRLYLRFESGGMKAFSELPGCADCGWYLPAKLDPKNFSFNTHWGACERCMGLGVDVFGKVCPECGGDRLKREYLNVEVGGKNIMEVSRMDIAGARAWFGALKVSKNLETVAAPLLKEITGRLDFLIGVGLGYIGLSRTGDTLSGGEAERIRLSGQIGSGLEGVLYVLDEPTVGLHQSDTKRLLETLKKLRDLGNTLVVVEHDLEVMRAADYIIDLGPSAGEHGGEVVAKGTPAELSESSALQTFPRSKTVPFLAGVVPIFNPEIPPQKDLGFYEFHDLHEHNLKHISVKIPKGRITTVCGVSGSGKSSLVMECIYPLLKRSFAHKKARPQVKLVDQSPIAGTPRSTPVSYSGAMDQLRKLFAQLEQAKVKGFTASRFSYNSGPGRCQACGGRGAVSIEMHFLSDVWEVCEECGGKRYNKETLEVTFKGRNIAEILDLTIDEALHFFADQPKISGPLKTFQGVGLGYLRLGQSVTTLSGGESQRMKLAAELGSAQGEAVYLLDEPTTGLHLSDIQILWNLLRNLSARGATIVIVEHHPDIIRLSDWLIELGPTGGDEGGYLMRQGENAAAGKG